MAKIKFYLKIKKSNPNEGTVMALVTGPKGLRKKLSTGKVCNPKHWSEVNHNFKAGHKNQSDENKYLDDWEKKLNSIINDADLNGIEIGGASRYLNNKMIEKTESSENSTFWKAWGERMQANTNNHNYKELTVKKWDALAGHIRKFESKYANLVLDEIDTPTLEKFRDYLYQDRKEGKKVKKGLNKASTAKYLRLFKTHLIWCFGHGHTKNEAWRTFSNSKKTEIELDPVILTKNDIAKIEALDLSGKKYLDNCRSLLMISIDTCFRFSDYTDIKQHHLDPIGKTLQKITIKTKKRIKIPLTFKAVERIQGLIKGEIHTISLTKFNEYVKELCKLAGINQRTEWLDTKGGGEVIRTSEKWELVSSHIGRRTGATLAVNRGMPLTLVRLMTGHKNIKQLLAYIGHDEDDDLEEMRKYIEDDDKAVMKVS